MPELAAPMSPSTQDLIAELLLLPGVVLAFVTSLLTAHELRRCRFVALEQFPNCDFQFRIRWHVGLPLCGVICGILLLQDSGPSWILFGDSLEVLLILLAWLAIRGPGGDLSTSKAHNAHAVAYVAGFHAVALLVASFGASAMTAVFAGLFAYETSEPVRPGNSTNLSTVIFWEHRLHVARWLMWLPLPAFCLSIWLWTWLVSQRRQRVSLTTILMAIPAALAGSTGLLLAIAWWPMPEISGALAESTPQFALLLLTRGGLLLALLSFLISYELSAQKVIIHAAPAQTPIRQGFVFLTCITAVITANWIPVVQASRPPYRWSAAYWMRGLQEAWEPQYAPMNLLYFAILMLIVTGYIRHWKNSSGASATQLATIDWRSLWLRVPVVFVCSVLTVLSVFWLATGVWTIVLNAGHTAAS